MTTSSSPDSTPIGTVVPTEEAGDGLLLGCGQQREQHQWPPEPQREPQEVAQRFDQCAPATHASHHEGRHDQRAGARQGERRQQHAVHVGGGRRVAQDRHLRRRETGEGVAARQHGDAQHEHQPVHDRQEPDRARRRRCAGSGGRRSRWRSSPSRRRPARAGPATSSPTPCGRWSSGWRRARRAPDRAGACTRCRGWPRCPGRTPRRTRPCSSPRVRRRGPPRRSRRRRCHRSSSPRRCRRRPRPRAACSAGWRRCCRTPRRTPPAAPAT